MSRKRSPNVTADDVLEALAERHRAPAWALVSQVRNQTGYRDGKIRTCDALAMSLWPSRGLELHGFEIKVARSDWLAELDDPAKADGFVKFCDRWWVVAPPLVVVPAELPKTWGLMVLHGKKSLRIEVDAPVLGAAMPPSRAFLAAILRKVATENEESPGRQRMARIKEAARHRGFDEGMQAAKNLAGNTQHELETLLARVREFEAVTGVSISRSWDNVGNISRAVRALLHESHDEYLKDLARLRESAAAIEGQVQKEIDKLAEVVERHRAARAAAEEAERTATTGPLFQQQRNAQ